MGRRDRDRHRNGPGAVRRDPGARVAGTCADGIRRGAERPRGTGRPRIAVKRAEIAERPAWVDIAVVSYIALAILLKLLYSARIVSAGATESIVVRTAL